MPRNARLAADSIVMACVHASNSCARAAIGSPSLGRPQKSSRSEQTKPWKTDAVDIERFWEKLGVRSRVQAVILACERGLVRPGGAGGVTWT